MLDPRPPLAVADAEEEPEEVGVGASVWMENICSDEEDWAMTTGSSTYGHDMGQGDLAAPPRMRMPVARLTSRDKAQD
jgi:hypothetical protein